MNTISHKFSAIAEWLAGVTLLIAASIFANALGGFGKCFLHLAVVEEKKKTIDDQLLEMMGGLSQRLKALEEIQTAVKQNKADYDQVTTVVNQVKGELDTFRKQQISLKTSRLTTLSIDRQDQVSDDCAKHLGAIALILGMQCGKLQGKSLDIAQSEIKNIIGAEWKSALTSSDIPLPTQYSGEVVELVYQYGVARKVGTVYPLGMGTVKLPKLSSSPTFGLIAQSGSITEKSPQTAWVTFTPEKFGGLIRLPSEIDEDSIVAMGQFLARYAARQMAQVEDYNFFRSTGADSGQNGAAKGLTTSVNASNDNIVYSQGGATNSGKTAQTNMTLADLRNLRGLSGINGAVLSTAKYFMHPTYESALVQFNTSATVTPYLRGQNGQGATLDGFPIVWVPDMPVLSSTPSASLCHVLFGDATFNYLGVRRGFAFDTSKEAAFTTDEILVRALERFTIGKMAVDCMAGLLNSAT